MLVFKLLICHILKNLQSKYILITYTALLLLKILGRYNCLKTIIKHIIEYYLRYTPIFGEI